MGTASIPAFAYTWPQRVVGMKANVANIHKGTVLTASLLYGDIMNKDNKGRNAYDLTRYSMSDMQNYWASKNAVK